MPRKFAWANLPDEQLLDLRLKDLGVRIDGTWLEGCINRLDEEMAQRGLRVRPHFWLSDEWFSPDNTPGVAIPFFLAHPRLMRLERKKILEVDGGSPRECIRILRHEAGHVLQHAYRLNRRRRWQQTFGRSSTRYPMYYRPNPASRHFVQHLRLWYAQSHPDEDFAETFAVWLRPRSDWRSRYHGWPALKKLQYVDDLMDEIADERPLLTRRFSVDPLSQNTRTLREYYERKQALYAVKPTRTYDRDLRRIFSDDPEDMRGQAASTFLRHNRAKIRQIVARWTGEHQLTLDSLLDDMIVRCRELKLRAVGREDQLRTDFTVLFTAKTVLSLYGSGRRKWFAL
jgi:hypothetical protein